MKKQILLVLTLLPLAVYGLAQAQNTGNSTGNDTVSNDANGGMSDTTSSATAAPKTKHHKHAATSSSGTSTSTATGNNSTNANVPTNGGSNPASGTSGSSY